MRLSKIGDVAVVMEEEEEEERCDTRLSIFGAAATASLRTI
jgi:hypothetical protein